MGDYSRNIRIGGRVADLSRPWVMGIINVTPDSFFADSRTFSAPEVEDRARRMADEGADCFDVGGYSSRPGADEVSASEETERVCRGIEAVRSLSADIPVSVDTFRADVDYCLTEALTKVGILGVKVWICHGTVYGKRDLFEIAGASASQHGGQQAPQGRGPRGGAPRNKRRNNNNK